MRRPQFLLAVAWVVYIVAWFLPVVRGEATFPETLPGWGAFRVAASALWAFEGIHTHHAVLCVTSAVTSAVFLPVSVWAAFGGSRRMRLVAWAAAGAFVFNTHWIVIFGSDRGDLRIGYYLWWISFLLLALALFALSRAEAPKDAST